MDSSIEPSSLNVTCVARLRDIQRFFGGGFSVTTGLGAGLSFGGGFRFSFGGVFTFSFGGGFAFSFDFGGVFVFVTRAGFVNGFSQTPSRNVPPFGHAQVLSSSFRGGSHLAAWRRQAFAALERAAVGARAGVVEQHPRLLAANRRLQLRSEHAHAADQRAAVRRTVQVLLMST